MARIELEVNARIATPADKCWDRAGGWATIHEWHPAIAKTDTEGEGVGALRTLTLGDGAQIKERLDSVEAMRYGYTFLEHPLPVDEYHGNIGVTDNGDGTSTVTWGANFVAKGASDEEAKEVIAGIFKAGLDALASEFSS